MMQRKKHGGSVVSSNDDDDDDGGSAKQKSFLQKPTHLLLGSRIRAAITPSKSSSSSASRQSSKSPEFCLPGVPVVLKLVILSFVGFAVLVVLTAKGRHSHWRYKNNALRSAHMPQPLLDRIKNSSSKVGGGSEWGSKSSSDKNMGVVIKSESSSDATQRMLAQSSRFVDSEKKLKQQLAQLLEKQDNEKKHKVNDLTGSVLGIKISTRYLGEDILPYPEAKRNEKEWEKKMEQRKKELATADEREWNNMIQQYDKVMEKHIQENEHVDHAVGALDEHEDTDQSIIAKFIAGEVAQENKETAIIRPPKASEQWPSPSEKAGADTTILLKPAFGSHRPLQDAILIFAEGYDLSIYLAFVESLKSTGYTGDLVISISNEEKLKPGVKEYLESHSKNSDTGVNVVAYEVNWSCFKQSGEAAAGSNEGINHCKMDNAFGDAKGNPISDPRAPRPVATARYELYWIWSLQYNKESWLMLIDARDVWFQLHPFKELEDRGKVSGELHLFGENADAVRIGTSNYNRRWLITAYGETNVKPFFEQPVICSGSTIGNQDAIETYLRAMVAEYDTTLCKQKGCDQGFHNYLYYSGKLKPVEGIAKIIVHEQGKGIINNLGALRTKPLKEWGLYDTKRKLVLNWDGSTSAVAHQYDRDKEANIMVKGKKKQFEQDWKTSKL